MNLVLVVDDAPEVLLLVCGILESAGFAVRTAGSTNEAETLLEKLPVELLLLDIDLPGQDGLSYCRQLRQRGRTLPIVMLTAQSRVEQLAAGLDGGADDYIRKPFAPEELLARVRAQLRREEQARMRVESMLKERWERIHDGLNLVQELQQPWIRPRVRHLQSAAHYIPVGRIGGDFYLLRELDEWRTYIVIGDTMGRGVGASLAMSWTLSVLNEKVQQGLVPCSLLTQLNSELGPSLEELGIFVAVFCALYDARKGTFTYSIAGHDPPLFLRPKGQRRKHLKLKPGGLPIGVYPDLGYDQQQVEVQARDRLFMFTDGLTEAVPTEQQPALFRRLYRTLLQSDELDVQQQTEAVLSALQASLPPGTFLTDDVTLVLLEFT